MHLLLLVRRRHYDPIYFIIRYKRGQLLLFCLVGVLYWAAELAVFAYACVGSGEQIFFDTAESLYMVSANRYVDALVFVPAAV